VLAHNPNEPQDHPKGHNKKRLIFIWLAVAALLCGIGTAFAVAKQTSKPASQTGQPGQSGSYATTAMKVGGKTYTLQIADTPEKQALGLGKRSNMQPREGMVFPYKTASKGLCFWMKDMNFSLDIIWLDSDKQIVHIEPSLSPSTYPQTYCPPKPSQYVVELNAGIAHALKLYEGQKLTF
jgi:uncharacterized membrane protein (UPF0127 family)